ncbi:MAG TPA: hypothetical protein VF148_04330 [Acidimicrobiia bacterium]
MIHQIWVSVLVGGVMPLGTAGELSVVSTVHASNEVFDSCTEESVEFLDSEVILEPEQVEFQRLEDQQE